MKYIKYFSMMFFLLIKINGFSQDVIERGLGYSYIVFSESETGTYNSIEKIYGDTINGGMGSVYSLNPDHDVQKSYLVKNGDINGDGMDETIVVYHSGTDKNGDDLGDNSMMVVYDGNDGQELFSRSGVDNGAGCYMLETGDFNGDGKDEIVHVRYATADSNGNGFADGSYLEIIDENNVTIWDHSPQEDDALGLDPLCSMYLLKKGDFNGDHYDDIAMVYHFGVDKDGDGQGDKGVMLVYDVSNDIKLFHRFGVDNGAGCYMLDVCDFNGDGKDEIVHVRYATADSNGNGFADGSYLEIIDENNVTVWDHSPQEDDALGLDPLCSMYLLKKGDFNGDHNDDIAMVYHFGVDKDGDGQGDKGVMLVYDIKNDIKLFHRFGAADGAGCYMLETCDFNNDNADEIVWIRYAGGDYDGDGFADECFLATFDYSNQLIFYYSPQYVGLENQNKIKYINTGDFNGDGNNDLVIMHEDNGELIVIDGTTQGAVNNAFYHLSNGNNGNLIAVINNEITDEELIRSIDDITGVTIDNIGNYFDYFKNIKSFTTSFPITPREFYISPNPINKDYFIENIKSYSTTYNYDRYFHEDIEYTSDYNFQPSKSGTRLERLHATIRTRLNSLDIEQFRYGIKSILSHVRYLLQDRHYYKTPGVWTSNKGPLFVDRPVLYSFLLLNEYKEFNVSNSGWQDIINSRIEDYLANHVFPDGVVDECAPSYEWWVAIHLAEFVEFKRDNSWLNIAIDSTLIKYNLENMYEYLMYYVKPLEPSIDITSSNKHVSDLPMIGDSYGILGETDSGRFGKKTPDHPSILTHALDLNVINKNSTIGKKLNFVAEAITYPQYNDTIEPVSKFFEHGKRFISRSNWLDINKKYDLNSRYCFFRAGEFLPRSSDSRHQHADVLSIELAAYNKNLVIDPGGYINYADNYDENRFVELYGSEMWKPEVRHYFKGTAAHNTVYINNNDQIKYGSSFSWDWTFPFDPAKCHMIALPMIADTQSEFDYAKAGYYKTYDHYQDESHDRTLLYIKPLINNEIKNDYWICYDIIKFNASSTNNETSQNWNISPQQSSVSSGSDYITECDNFWIIPLSSPNLTKEVVGGYYSANPKYEDILAENEIVKYKKSESNSNPINYLTIIFPFKESIPLENPTNITKMDVMKKVYIKGRWVLQSVSDEIAQAFHLTFTIDGNTYHDFCIISHSEFAQELYWDRDGDGKIFMDEEHLFDSRMEFIRYEHDPRQRNNIGAELKHLSLNYGTSEKLNLESKQIGLPTKYDLYQNHPNPFNPVTIINFDIPKQSNVSIKVYDIQGRVVNELFNGKKDAGRYTAHFNGGNLSSGVYFYEMVAGNYRKVKKMMLVK